MNNFIGKYFTLVNLYNILWNMLIIFVILVIMYLIIKIGNILIDVSVSRKKRIPIYINENRSKTYGYVLKSILKYSVYFLGTLVLLSTVFGVKGLAFASIGSLAIAFAAQSLIKDIINGFFILIEDQYSIGDYITIDDKSGVVEGVELRITRIKDYSGDIHIIPNGSISSVTNHSRGTRRVKFDVEIAYDENLDNAFKVINKVCGDYSKEDSDMVEEAKVFGLTSLNKSSVSITIMGKAKPNTEAKCEMQLRKRVKEELDKEGIRIPYPIIQLIKGE